MHASLPGFPSSVFRRHTIVVVALLCFACACIHAQTPNNLTYTNDYPSVERVKAEIKGSDPTDTLARQVGVLTYLSTQIQRIKLNRDYRGPFTPDETRLMTAYTAAAYQMTQDYNKTHTSAEAQAFDRLQFNYSIDGAFRKDWTARLIGPQGQNAYKSAQADLAATQQRHYNQEMQTYNDAQKQQQATATNPAGLSNDPTAVATRRCLELGGSNIACMGKSFINGLIGMVGVNMDAVMDSTRSAGVVLSGLYKSSSGASMAFGEATASTTNCGDLTPVGYPYNIEKQGSSISVLLHNEPKPFTLTMRPDGGFTGPGLISVTGKIITGYDTVTKTQMIDGRAAMFDECNGPCQTTSRTPVYSPKTERCAVSSLAPPPKRKPQPAQPAGADSGLMGMLTETLNTGEMTMNAEDGFRIVGKYSDGRLLLDFTTTSVILDCDHAHIRSTYTVENAPSTFIVHIDNPAGPIALAVQPDNSLRGSGSTTINGRLVTGMQGDQVTFTPTRASCELATFQPQNGNTGTKVAAATEPPPPTTRAVSSASASPGPVSPGPVSPVPPSSTSAAPASSASVAPAPAALAGSARLLITTAFPTGANPLVGRNILLMKDSYENVLRKIGVPIPPGTTPGKAMKSFAIACRPPADCKAANAAMAPYFVGRATVDPTGKAIVAPQLPPGSYFVSVAAPTTGAVLVWDVKVDLKPGENSVTLDPHNAESVP
jgi:hypothetical protein